MNSLANPLHLGKQCPAGLLAGTLGGRYKTSLINTSPTVSRTFFGIVASVLLTGSAQAAPSTQSDAGAAGWKATLEKRATWWSFQPLQKPEIPAAATVTDTTHPVDRFIQSRLQRAGLQPSGEADRTVLLRRLTFVLTGLPPSPDQIAAFGNDPAPDAYERVVDRLLDSPQFGERWARHWMDLVRYCESHGSQGDPELPMAWRYRDYLIRAFNTDVPYDQLVREQIAGDLLPNPRLNPAEGLNESAIGPAHLRMVEHGYIPVDALDDCVKAVDNQIDVVTKAFLGLTVSCARCHDHKFDPISQRDFYALYGILASCRPGQVVIDAPERRARNLYQLAALKARIRHAPQSSWRVAAQAVRDATNVPAQALTLLNDPFVIEMATRWARRAIAEGQPRDHRIASLFLRALGRPITPDEAAAANEFVEALASEHRVPMREIESHTRTWQDFIQSLFCMKEFIYVE